MASKQETLRTPFLFVTDTNKKNIKLTVVPNDLQVGFSGNPAALDLMGSLSVSTSIIDASFNSTNVFLIDNTKTFVGVDTTEASASSRTTVNLPSTPKEGQLVIIKDNFGNADSVPIDIKTDFTIDGQSQLTLSASYDSVGVIWNKDEWKVIIPIPSQTSSSSSSSFVSGDYIALGPDPAETGGVRLSNGSANGIYFEASPPGTDVAGMYLDSSENLQIGDTGTAVTINTSTGLLVAVAGSTEWNINDSDIRPNVDAANDLGTSTKRLKDGYFSGFLALGSDPADTGAIRLSNGSANGIYFEASPAGTDVGIYVDASEVLHVGVNAIAGGAGIQFYNGVTSICFVDDTGFRPSVDATFYLGAGNTRWIAGYFSAYVAIGDDPADTGGIRLSNGLANGIYFESSPAGTDALFAFCDTDESIYIGSTTNPALYLRSNTGGVQLMTQGVLRWFADDNGFWRPGADATYDIGSDNLRVRAVYVSDYIALGANPADTGGVRLSNGSSNGIYFEASPASTDIAGMYLDSSEQLQIGDSGATVILNAAGSVLIAIAGATEWNINDTDIRPAVDNANALGTSAKRLTNGFFSGFLALGDDPADTGAIRLQNGSGGGIYWEASPASTDIGIYVDSAEQLVLADRWAINASSVLYPGVDASYDLGGSTQRIRDGYFSSAILIGSDPADTGAIRLSNGASFGIYWEASPASTDIGIYVDSSEQLVLADRWAISAGSTLYPGADASYDLGGTSTRVRDGYFSSAILIGTNPATEGPIRMANNVNIWARNAANSQNFALIGSDSSNNVYIAGDADSAATLIYAANVERIRVNSTGIGFNAVTPIARPDYTITNPTTNRSIDVSTITLSLLAQVVGTMIQDNINYGLYQ